MARGINVGADVLTSTVDGVDLSTIWDDFIQSLRAYNSTQNAMLGLLVHRTSDASDLVPLDGDGVEFEVQSEFGVPKAGRPEPKHFVAGYPLEWSDLAARYTRKFLREAKRGQIDAVHSAALAAADQHQFREALRALTVPSSLGGRSINEVGASIYSLYSGSSDDIPPQYAGRTFSSGHTHYLTSGAATVDGQDLEDVIEHIAHHGFGIGSNERIVLLVHPDQGKTIRGFRAGVNSSPYDFIPSESAPAYLSTEFIVGNTAPKEFNGLEVIGSFGKALIVESYYAFSGYVIGVAFSGANSTRNVLSLRSHPQASQRGLNIIPGDTNAYPIVNSYYELGVGFGVRNRGAAAIMQITASGTYSAPTLP